MYVAQFVLNEVCPSKMAWQGQKKYTVLSSENLLCGYVGFDKIKEEVLKNSQMEFYWCFRLELGALQGFHF